MSRDQQDRIERGMPINIDAERFVLGSILLDDSLYAEASSSLESDDFSLSKHRRIFKRMGDLQDRGEKIDRITVANELAKYNELEACDGLSYLVSLDDGLPQIPNIDAYVGIVKDKASLRKIIFASQHSMNRALMGEESPSDILEAMEEQILALNDRQVRTGPISPAKIIENYEGGLNTFLDPTKRPKGLGTGFAKLDSLTGGLHRGGLFILAARPSVGKTAFALNVAANAALKTHARVAIFSCEMSREELLTRMVCSTARVDSQRFRSGWLTQEERNKLKHALFDIVELGDRLVIDDSGSLTVMDVRAKAGKLKADPYGLDLVIIDYLQLMTSKGKSENRNQEVSTMSRGLKLAAKDLDVPMMVLSQLSRAVEQRAGDHRPRLSDLRESGCLLTKTSRLFADDGVRYGTILRMNTYSLSKASSVVSRVSKYLPTGNKKVIRVVLESGRFIDCTPDHKILTDRGFKPAEEISRDYSIAAVRRIPEPEGRIYIPESKWIGRMLGNGSMQGYGSPGFICSCEDVAKDFCKQTEELFGLVPRYHPHHKCSKVWQYDITAGPVRTSAGNPVKNWMVAHDLWGSKAPQKRVPDWFTEQADNRSIAELVAGMWETDGTVTRRSLKYATTSNELGWQLIWMLTRLGIFASINDGSMGEKSTTPGFTILVANWKDVERFRSLVPMIGRKGRVLQELGPPQKLSGSNHGDRIGIWINEEITKAIRAAGMSWRTAGYRCQSKRISQADLGRVIRTVPGLNHLKPLVSPDIYWDRFDRFDVAEPGEVFDRHVIGGPHNFVANGIIVHNSIEQDADVVGFLFREEMYAPDREDLKGLAELILAKQRSGPTGTVDLVFLNNTTRFESRAEDVGDEYGET